MFYSFWNEHLEYKRAASILRKLKRLILSNIRNLYRFKIPLKFKCTRKQEDDVINEDEMKYKYQEKLDNKNASIDCEKNLWISDYMRSCFYPLSTIPTQGIKKPLPKETNYLSSFASERIYIYSTITVILFPLFLN